MKPKRNRAKTKRLINYAQTQQCAGQREEQGLGLRHGPGLGSALSVALSSVLLSSCIIN